MWALVWVLAGLPVAFVLLGLLAGPVGDRLLWLVEDWRLLRAERSPVPADDDAYFAACAEDMRRYE